MENKSILLVNQKFRHKPVALQVKLTDIWVIQQLHDPHFPKEL